MNDDADQKKPHRPRRPSRRKSKAVAVQTAAAAPIHANGAAQTAIAERVLEPEIVDTEAAGHGAVSALSRCMRLLN